MAKRILVVDDDPVIIKLTTSILKNNGYDVTFATDGRAAFVPAVHP